MSPKHVKPPNLRLEVVLDTNALYTGSANYFLRKEVADLIEQNSTLPDLTIRWIVPEVVRHERHFQMLQVALQMLPTIERLERLLGHNLNITKEILDTRVKEAIEREIQHHGIVVQPLNPVDIDWQRVMLDAAYRRPPFQLGEKEKGFRDALILETFVQLIASVPTSRSVARLVLVSNDQLLRDATESRRGPANNIHVLESIDALKSLINTLGSAVDEQFIAAIEPRAAELFFTARDETTLYYRASVHRVLERTVRETPVKLPAGAEKYHIEKWMISPPGFVKKQGQRIYWTTRFEAKLKALKSVPPGRPRSGSAVPLSNLLALTELNAPLTESPLSSGEVSGSAFNALAGKYQQDWTTFLSVAEDQLVDYGTASLDASWSVAVTTSGKLTKPRLESVNFVEVVWGTGS